MARGSRSNQRRRDDRITVADITPVEAAFVTGLSAKAVNAAIDRKEIEAGSGGGRRKGGVRRLGFPELIYLALRPRVSGVLTAASRRELYVQIRSVSIDLRRGSMKLATAVRAAPIEIGLITVSFDIVLDQVLERLREIDAMREYVVTDPEIRGGEPVVKGTRVPVHRLAELANQGVPERELLDDHPAVSASALRAALTYARTHPRRGRPKRGPWHRSGRAA